ncbi:MAG: hypothetical protein A2070_03960 [Bdellovibrionales bacterium GWC1_52_8]|nr:MAG: hypothetical protein A2X97_13020 [Bdellovibrionales bacterium GWA1_52_35]OFZ44048.1 MAG: hypothetical protein A2070_03960 [Bdellovibrionales bacterium GWC1_52_8]
MKQIWAVGGGKGGVGKSLIASSLAISASRLGNSVVVVDLDLGGANLHTALGLDLPKNTLSDFFSDRVPSLEACRVQTGIQHLDIISGAQDAIGVANVSDVDKTRLLTALNSLDTDYLIFDLGAGTTFNTIDFFLSSNVGIITLLPEPTSIENAYRFIKSAYFRHLRNDPKLLEVQALIDVAMDSRNERNIRTPSDLFREVSQSNPEAAVRLKRSIACFNPKLIVNQARTQSDIDVGYSVKTVCKKYFGIEMDYLGYLDYDSSVWQAIRRKRPMLLEFPNSRLVMNIDRMVQQIFKRYNNVKK